MDQELATAVFKRWNDGLPVAEATFHKAASVLGLNADDALLEARFYTLLDHDLKKVASGQSLDQDVLSVYAQAAGYEPTELVKVASAYSLQPQGLILRKLAERNWVPDLEKVKVALMGSPQADPAAGGMGGVQNAAMPAMPEPDQAQALPPQQGAMVQQSPSARYKPSPMAPVQSPPSAEGNLRELAEAARHPDAGSEMGMGGMGPDAGMPSEMGPSDAPPPMAPEEKLQQVDPSIDPQTMARWAPKLQEIEEQTGIQMTDPGQVQKFIGEMQKADQKTLDEAIKAIGQPSPLARPTNDPNKQLKPQGPAGQAEDPQAQQQPQQEKLARRARAILP